MEHKHADCLHTSIETGTSDDFDGDYLHNELGSTKWLRCVFRACGHVDKKYERKEEWERVSKDYQKEFIAYYKRCQEVDKNFDTFRNMGKHAFSLS